MWSGKKTRGLVGLTSLVGLRSQVKKKIGFNTGNNVLPSLALY